jgi:hypothetical protein
VKSVTAIDRDAQASDPIGVDLGADVVVIHGRVGIRPSHLVVPLGVLRLDYESTTVKREQKLSVKLKDRTNWAKINMVRANIKRDSPR